MEGHEFAVDATVTNSGAATWLPSSADPGGVALGVHLYDSSRRLVTFDYHWVALTSPPRAVPAGETVRCRVTLPPLTAGRYWLEFDCVAQRVAWFAQIGSGAAAIPVEVGR